MPPSVRLKHEKAAASDVGARPAHRDPRLEPSGPVLARIRPSGSPGAHPPCICHHPPVRREPRHKVARRFGFDVYGTGGAALARRLERRPGQQAQARRRKPSEYAHQLHEKQKAKAVYGVSEGQLRRLFEEAQSRPGVTGETLLELLERRLDNTVYRLGFARSRPMARQLVSHGHVTVDSERVTIPSYRVNETQTIGVTDDAAKMPVVVEEMASGRPIPAWLERSPKSRAGRVARLPQRSDVELPIDESLITSYYAR